MPRDIPEPDWKIFRQLQPVVLERFCQRVLEELKSLIADKNKTNHERYLAISKLLEERDEELAFAFNEPRRSTALLQLAAFKKRELITQEEMAGFSDQTRDALEGSFS